MSTLSGEGLVQRYGDLVAVDGVSIAASPGSVLALLGPNGAGKTTTLAMLAGTTRPVEGRVCWDGRPAEPGFLRRTVGLAPQELQLWGLLSCIEQLRFLAELAGVPGREAARRAGDLLERLGLGERRDVQARRLSCGMQRRLNLALALVGDPPAVVLDEPGAGLDPQSRVLVRDLIAELAVDKVVIVTSHDLAEIERLADRIVIIDRGRVLAEGTAAQLQAAHTGGTAVTFATTIAGAAGLAGALGRLRGAVTVSGTEVECVVTTGTPIGPALEAAAACGVPLLSVHTREPSLEDVFLQLTGRSLRE